MGEWITEQIATLPTVFNVCISDGEEGGVWPAVAMLHQRNRGTGEDRVVLGVLHPESGAILPFVERGCDGLTMSVACDRTFLPIGNKRSPTSLQRVSNRLGPQKQHLTCANG